MKMQQLGFQFLESFCIRVYTWTVFHYIILRTYVYGLGYSSSLKFVCYECFECLFFMFAFCCDVGIGIYGKKKDSKLRRDICFALCFKIHRRLDSVRFGLYTCHFFLDFYLAKRFCDFGLNFNWTLPCRNLMLIHWFCSICCRKCVPRPVSWQPRPTLPMRPDLNFDILEGQPVRNCGCSDCRHFFWFYSINLTF